LSILSVENLSKSYGEKVLFDNLSFTISEGQRIGIIGINGTGKSTLLKTIAGIEGREGGQVTHANQFRIEYLHQEPTFDESASILDQIFYSDAPMMQVQRQYERALSDLESDPNNEKKQETLFALQQKMDSLNAWEANAAAKSILTRLGITDFAKSIQELSGGQRKRIALARALIQPSDLLILDEPTNHIDNETVEWLERYLAQYRGALLMVTHDRYFLNRVTNRIFELDRGKLYSYDGNYEYFLEKKAERIEQEQSSEQKRQNILRRELAWLHRGAKARTTKQKARIQRVETLKEQKNDLNNEKIEMAIGSSRLGKKVIEVNEISKSYDNRLLIKDFTYIVMPNDRLGIIGPNGSGKSTLLNMLAGRIQPDSGTIDTGSTVNIAYYTQNSIEMDDTMRVLEYIKEGAEVIYTKDGHAITAAQMLERFLFAPHMHWTMISKLSGGERRRLYLLRILMSEPNVLFLDEPTNDLDTETLAILEDYLESFPGAVITVSHDRYFLDRVVHHVFAFEGNGKLRDFIGSYSDYLDVRKLEREAEMAEEKEVKQTNNEIEKTTIANTNNKTRKLSFKEKREWEEVNEKIPFLEEKIKKLKEEVSTSGSDYGKVQDLFREQEQAEGELEAVIERWAELSEIIEEIEEQKGKA
jgi:ABC transport system ATP-binding/permease protein